MATQLPMNLQPVCKVHGCKNGCQTLALNSSVATWMATCKMHSYVDLPAEKERLETFWPPAND